MRDTIDVSVQDVTDTLGAWIQPTKLVIVASYLYT